MSKSSEGLTSGEAIAEELIGMEFDEVVSLAEHLVRTEPGRGRMVDPEFRKQLFSSLETQADGNFEHLARLVAVQIEIGRSYDDPELVYTGSFRLHTLSANLVFMKVFLNSISNLALLGDRMERWDYIRHVASTLIRDPHDPLLGFIELGHPEYLDELVSDGWIPAGQVPPSLSCEMSIQAAWRALDLSRGDEFLSRAGRLIGSDFLRQSMRTAPGRSWEFSAIKSIFKLLSGDVEFAYQLFPSSGRRPPWADQVLWREIHRFGLFALEKRREWLSLSSSHDAPPPASVEERLISDLVALLANPKVVTEQKIHNVVNNDEFPRWALIPALCEPELNEKAITYLCRQILKLPHGEHHLLPWKLNFERLKSALDRCSDNDTSARTALLLHRYTATDKSAEATAAILSSLALAQQLDLLSDCNSLERSTISTHLSEGAKLALSRGGTYRAIIDGSNVMCATLDIREEGAEPKLERLLQLIAEVKRSGYEEILVYFDFGGNGVWGRLTQREQEILRRMQANKQAVGVPSADPEVVSKFLEKPRVSEIFSNDRFRSDIRDRPEHQLLAKKLETVGIKRRFFHLDQAHNIVIRPEISGPARTAVGKDVWKNTL